jgi:hypothetical protein
VALFDPYVGELGSGEWIVSLRSLERLAEDVRLAPLDLLWD